MVSIGHQRIQNYQHPLAHPLSTEINLDTANSTFVISSGVILCLNFSFNNIIVEAKYLFNGVFKQGIVNKKEGSIAVTISKAS